MSGKGSSSNYFHYLQRHPVSSATGRSKGDLLRGREYFQGRRAHSKGHSSSRVQKIALLPRHWTVAVDKESQVSGLEMILDRCINYSYSSFRFNEFVRPACLWHKDHIDMEQAVATGWGVTKFGGQKSDDLLKVSLNLFSLDECKKLYGRHRRIPKGILASQLCAGSRTGEDTCQGDSGGPIQIMAKGNSCLFYIVGITSFGKSCASNSPGVYTKVSSYLNWIEEVVWPWGTKIGDTHEKVARNSAILLAGTRTR